MSRKVVTEDAGRVGRRYIQCYVDLVIFVSPIEDSEFVSRVNVRKGLSIIRRKDVHGSHLLEFTNATIDCCCSILTLNPKFNVSSKPSFEIGDKEIADFTKKTPLLSNNSIDPFLHPIHYPDFPLSKPGFH